MRAASHLWDAVSAALGELQRNEAAIRGHHDALLDGLADHRLSELPLTALRTSTSGRLSLAPLADAGFHNVRQLVGTTATQLDRLPGIGGPTARAVVAAVAELRRAAREDVRFRIEFDPANREATALLRALARHDELRAAASGVRDDLGELLRWLPGEIEAAKPAANPVRWLFTGASRRPLALASVERLRQGLAVAEQRGVGERADEIRRLSGARPADPWVDFERRAADYYALLSEFVPTTTPIQAGQGYLTEEVVARVATQELDQRLLQVQLRAYQSFGARFALAQRRVILGDEMGLGKTIQALAAIAHVRTFDARPVLVVCPASVMVNWEHEVRRRTTLAPLTLHGADRQDEVTRWLADGSIGVTTFETLRRLELPSDLELAALVVDEAHYVKNPRTARSRAVRRLTAQADNVWFLTGTPMENDVAEFRSLIRYLQSDLVPVDGPAASVGSVAFRRSVAPVYLRRNAEDVLVELPELQETDEWLRLSASDGVRYRRAVAAGNFMAMRQAGLSSADPARCAKTERLLELVVEAAANGRKVVIYSYFREAIELVGRALPIPSFGPITGDLNPAKRQQVVDDFTAHAGPAVLVAQIQAGGVGLNIQAASVVILVEPQLTPTSEDQAVARAHRMGQVRSVQVHRLLNEDSVDERLVELLAAKRAGFDTYARRSALAEATGAAIDLTVGEIAAQIVHAEQRRLRTAESSGSDEPTAFDEPTGPA